MGPVSVLTPVNTTCPFPTLSVMVRLPLWPNTASEKMPEKVPTLPLASMMLALAPAAVSVSV